MTPLICVIRRGRLPCYHGAMRIALLGDIHSNLAALRAVLDHAEDRRPVDRLWLLGDTVGYGPHPNECIALLRRYAQDAVAGNHDLAALGRIDTSTFNTYALAATAWTADALNGDSRAYLETQPEVLVPRKEDGKDDWTLVHGTLRDPVVEYLYSPAAALAHLRLQTTPFGAVGHTHIPAIAQLADGGERPTFATLPDGAVIELDGGGRVVLNPGGVGQPRDGDPRAAYALYDADAGVVTFHRVPYDIAATQRAMEAAGLPRLLINRLSLGR